ncbi:unnamed protein product [Sphagnum jensenii]|uniref:Uncharacterized protein n=2 Tax=Sphagnum jensenii TaxID=128206 RepID=A0ABP1AD19_9BRYO
MEEQQYLRMWFESVDEDKSGSINSLELQRALEVGNLKFPKSIVDQMIRMYDADQNGVMSFEGNADSFLVINIKLVFHNVRISHLGLWDQGFLALNEVYQALQQAGFTLDEPSFYTACQSFDPNRLGKFKLDDYISMCIFLQSAKNLFGAFDTSRIGHITLDFNQFVYCAANLRV